MKAGKKRRHRLIQEDLDKIGLTFADVSRQTKVSSSLVIETSQGLKNNKRVLQHFLDLGVNPNYLDLPKNMTFKGGVQCKTHAQQKS